MLVCRHVAHGSRFILVNAKGFFLGVLFLFRNCWLSLYVNVHNNNPASEFLVVIIAVIHAQIIPVVKTLN